MAELNRKDVIFLNQHRNLQPEALPPEIHCGLLFNVRLD